MRFSIITAIIAAAAGTFVVGAPISLEPRSDVTEISSGIAKLEEGLGISALEDELDNLLGKSLSKLEAKLGVTFAEKMLQLSEDGSSPGDLQLLGAGVKMLEDGLGITAVDSFLDKESGGAITSLEKTLGVTDIESAIGAA